MKKNNLKYLLLPWIKNVPNKKIKNIVIDSRTLTKKDVFIAIQGNQCHGNQFIPEAIKKKTTAVISETNKKNKHGYINYFNDTPIIYFYQLSKNLSKLSGRFYNYPGKKLKIIGITGTNGKTTVIQIINQWNNLFNKPVATMGTLGNGFYPNLIKSNNTTSSALEIQSFLYFSLKKKPLITMEVSSHGLAQNRVKNIPFYIAIFTNLTQDHLDYHKTMKQYELEKWSLFSTHKVKKIILNVNNSYAKKWLKKLTNKYIVLVTIKNEKYKKYANKWVNATNITFNGKYTNIKFESSWGSGTLSSNLIGNFNVENILLSFATMLENGHKLSNLILTSIQLTPVSGRMQTFKKIGKPIIVIDYAHTPDALKKSLYTIKTYYPKKKIWCIFGCGGERDIQKRPIMGSIAEKIANKIIITNDNPRNEDQLKIIDDIILGCKNKNNIIVIPDRKKAIFSAFFNANIKDIIFISGKGHENYQIIGNKSIYYSDEQVVRTLLEK